MPIAAQHIKAALTHLRKKDPVMKEVIKRVGPFTHKLKRNAFDMLVNSILSQQISVAAATTIRNRLRERVGGKVFKPELLVPLSIDQLREVGVSRQKAGYVLDLANKVNDGSVKLQGFSRKSNQEIIDELILVKGIGIWTAQIFLMFSLGRLDVFPVDDLGLRNAMKGLYELDDESNKLDYLSIAEKWAPYETIASWYLWQSLDNSP